MAFVTTVTKSRWFVSYIVEKNGSAQKKASEPIISISPTLHLINMLPLSYAYASYINAASGWDFYSKLHQTISVFHVLHPAAW